MHALPSDWVSLCAVVFALGMRHGFDADHLAAIDGLTRHNARAGRSLARACGALFCAGHGAVVMAVAVGVALARSHWQTPAWLETHGAWVSIGFLTLIGVANLKAVFGAAPGEVVAPVGFKGRLLGRLARAQHPAGIAFVGALFALSFDTVSQSALFAMTAAQFGGLRDAVALGGLFVTGMFCVDAANGLWVARLIRSADARAARASRVMGVGVGLASLLVAGFGAARMALPGVDVWGNGVEPFVSVVVVMLVALSYLAARAAVRRDHPRDSSIALRVHP